MNDTNEASQRRTAAILAALLDGMRIQDGPLNLKCCLALLAIGDGAIRYLNLLIDDRGTRPTHRQRLRDIVARIGRKERPRQDAVECGTAAFLEEFPISDRRINNLAAHAFAQLGEGSVDRLITAAVLNRRKSGYCERLLSVAERIGRPSVEGYLDLACLLTHRRIEICNLAARLQWRGTNESAWSEGRVVATPGADLVETSPSP